MFKPLRLHALSECDGFACICRRRARMAEEVLKPLRIEIDELDRHAQAFKQVVGLVGDAEIIAAASSLPTDVGQGVGARDAVVGLEQKLTFDCGAAAKACAGLIFVNTVDNTVHAESGGGGNVEVTRLPSASCRAFIVCARRPVSWLLVCTRMPSDIF